MPSITLARAAVIAAGLLASTASAAFNPASSSNVVVYWGQGFDQIPLEDVCNDPSVDIVTIGFVNRFPQKLGDYPGTNFANACGDQTFTQPDGKTSHLLAHCPSIEPGIKSCQAKGKKVLLSIGGGWPTDYYIPSIQVADYFAEFLWGAFGPQTAAWVNAGKPRPFGDASFDGFDLDIESRMEPAPFPGYQSAYYYRLVNHLKNNLFPKGPGSYYISGAPQCLVPDSHLADAIRTSHFDFIFTQFYNTETCSARLGYSDLKKTSTQFTFDAWVSWLNANSKNKNVKLYLGLPAGAAGAGAKYPHHYLTPTEANDLITVYQKKHPSKFGGVMLWEATVSARNTKCNKGYLTWIKEILAGQWAGKKFTEVCSVSSTIRSSTSSRASSTSSRVTSTPTVTSTAIPSKSSSASSILSTTSSARSSSLSSSPSPTSTAKSSTLSSSASPSASSTVESSSSSSSVSPSPSSTIVSSSSAISSTGPFSSSLSSTEVPFPTGSNSTSIPGPTGVSSSADISTGSSSTIVSSTSVTSSVHLPTGGSTGAPFPTFNVTSSTVSQTAPFPNNTISFTISSTSFTEEPTLSSTPEPTFSSTPEPTLSSTPEPTLSSTLLSTPEPTSTSCSTTISVSGHPSSSSSQGYPEYPASTSSKEYPEYPTGPSIPGPSTTGKPEQTPSYPTSTTTTVITTTYVDVCSTGLTTITATITKTICPVCPTATPSPGEVPEDWTTTVTVCTHCGPKTTTVTVTKPIDYPTEVPEVPEAPEVPHVPEVTKATEIPAPSAYPTHPGESKTAPVPYPTGPVGAEQVDETETATSTVVKVITLTKVPVLVKVTPAPYGPANSTAVYPTGTVSATGSGVYPTYSPAPFEGAASRFSVGISAVAVVLAGMLAL